MYITYICVFASLLLFGWGEGTCDLSLYDTPVGCDVDCDANGVRLCNFTASTNLSCPIKEVRDRTLPCHKGLKYIANIYENTYNYTLNKTYLEEQVSIQLELTRLDRRYDSSYYLVGLFIIRLTPHQFQCEKSVREPLDLIVITVRPSNARERRVNERVNFFKSIEQKLKRSHNIPIILEGSTCSGLYMDRSHGTYRTKYLAISNDVQSYVLPQDTVEYLMGARNDARFAIVYDIYEKYL